MTGDALVDHATRLEAWSEKQLRPYIRRLERHRPPFGETKEFNDAVWGTTQLRPDEVLILDSPLLQRLRRIRQLGVVHFVYPAATHTRLEHSLGVVHQVQQLVTSINEHGLPGETYRSGRSSAPVLHPSHERTLRLAALCHDVGHGAMSHVSEYAVEDDRHCDDIRIAFGKMQRKGPNQLSEIAAYYIIGSPAFRDLLREVDRLSHPEHVTDLQEKIQKIIIGGSVDHEILLLHELVSGPFDADKLDYLTRDATMCGVPVVVDVPRLVQKVRATRLDGERLPRKLRDFVNDRQNGYILTGIARSGARTLDEVALARTLMFDKIYRHHKVRAAEAMVSSLLHQLQVIVPVEPSMLPFIVADDELVGLTRDQIANLAGIPYDEMTETQRNATDVAAYLAARLRERRIFSRGFAFAPVMPRDDYRRDPAQTQGIDRFISDCGRPEVRASLTKELATRVRDICETIDQTDMLDVPGGQLEPFLWISGPKPPPKTTSSETGHAYLIDETGSAMQAEEDTAETPAWNDAFVTTRDLGYVFCLRRLAPIVYIATEVLVREKYGIRTPPTMLAYAKQNADELSRIKKALEAKGWYDGKANDLRPLPDVLLRSAAVARADEVVHNLQGYAGPFLPDDHRRTPGATVNRQQVLSFVRQFVDDDLVDAALTVIRDIKVIGRTDANQALMSFLSSYPEYSPASYCALGDSRDSSGLLTYYVGDVTNRHGLTQRGLVEALNYPEPIVFVDDLVGRGSQSISILENWLGVPPSQDLNERRFSPLSPALAEQLRQHKLGFVFVAGLATGEEALRSRLEELGLDATVFVHIEETELPFLKTVLRDPEVRSRFEAFCAERARSVLLAPDERHDEKWVEDRVLGYGNRGLLLVSTYNTPTATLSCLWAERDGPLAQGGWSALIPRRKKL